MYGAGFFTPVLLAFYVVLLKYVLLCVYAFVFLVTIPTAVDLLLLSVSCLSGHVGLREGGR